MAVEIYEPVSYAIDMPDCNTTALKDGIRMSSNAYKRALRNNDKSKRQNKDWRNKKRQRDSNDVGDNKYTLYLDAPVTVTGSNLNLQKTKEDLELAREALKNDATDISDKIDEIKDFIGSTFADAIEEISDKISEADENIKELREKITEINAEIKEQEDEDTDLLEADKEEACDDIISWNDYKADAKADAADNHEDKDKLIKCIGKLQIIYKTYYTMVIRKSANCEDESVDHTEDNIDICCKPKVEKPKVEESDCDSDSESDDDSDDDNDNECHVVVPSKPTLIDNLLLMLTKNKKQSMNAEMLKMCLRKCLKISEDIEKKSGCPNPLTKLLHTKLKDAIQLC